MTLNYCVTKQLMHKQALARCAYSTVTTSWLTTNNPWQGRSSNSNSMLTSVLLRTYLRMSKSKNKNKNSSILGACLKYRKKLNKKHKQTSFGVLYLYNMFFWSTVFGGVSSVFRKKEKSVANRFSNIYSSSEQNHRSMNRRFNNLYRGMQQKNLYTLSQPMTTILLGSNESGKKNKTNLGHSSASQKKIVAAVLGGYLPYATNSGGFKIQKNIQERELTTIKTSKIVYALNQYAISALLSL